ncbi:hypothetical protein BC940DRAFT_149940 [Gongronella butleri]|nr:hypothetical protein BC940DRAFT_149940 [Gongronella butleri]
MLPFFFSLLLNNLPLNLWGRAPWMRHFESQGVIWGCIVRISAIFIFIFFDTMISFCCEMCTLCLLFHLNFHFHLTHYQPNFRKRMTKMTKMPKKVGRCRAVCTLQRVNGPNGATENSCKQAQASVAPLTSKERAKPVSMQEHGRTNMIV